MNKHKIVNDPVYGFIKIESDIVYDLVQHPWFQRLRRIKQLGLTELVYPGATHTRLHHALGATHLIGMALKELQNKGVEISTEEYTAAQIAILLHDIGHGPFSHALENTILKQVHHEDISRLLFDKLAEEYGGAVMLARKIFCNEYPRKFFHQLVSGQLDVDRMDYLIRDGFFTGVSEGSIGSERIIKLLNVCNDELVIEEKGIYSIEHFLIARRVMYWQVYFHKTTVAAECMLIRALERARELNNDPMIVPDHSNLSYFLKNDISIKNLKENRGVLVTFLSLDDHDIWGMLKLWSTSDDLALKTLSIGILERNLFLMKIIDEGSLLDKSQYIGWICEKLGCDEGTAHKLIIEGTLSNEAYIKDYTPIKLIMKNGSIKEVSEASDLPNIKSLQQLVEKKYICYPR